MADLLTLAEAKMALTVFHNDDDDRLNLLIAAASEAVYTYLKWIPADYEVSGGGLDETIVPRQVRISASILVGYLYRNPDADPDRDFSHGNLPWAVTAMLYPLRDPALA